MDQYDGKVFDDYEPAMAYIDEVGFRALKTDEYQPAEAELMWARVTDFLERVGT